MSENLAIIGAGAIGIKHAEAARQVGAGLKWIVDADAARAEKLAAEYGTEATAEVEAVWRDPAVHAVVIGVPNAFHMPLAVAALEAGKDVLLEKPMALCAAECDQINRAAAANDRVLQIAFVHRYTGVGRAAKRIAQEGDLGEIYHAKAHLYLRRGIPGLGRWFTDRSIAGGGALVDVGVHLIDLALHVTDFPVVKSVHGKTYGRFGCRMEDYVYEQMWAGPPRYEGIFDVEDSAHALIEFESGATLDLNVAWAGNFPSKALPTSLMGFFGDEGGMTFELFGSSITQTREESGQVVDVDSAVAETDPFAEQMADFVGSVATRSVTGATGAQGRQVQAVVDAIYEASGRPSTAHVGETSGMP